MRTLQTYLSEYSESHQNPQNIKIHNICVPAIMWSLLGFLHTFSISANGELRLSHILTFGALLFYGFLKDVRLVLVMSGVTIAMFISFNWIPYLRWVSVVVFALAWVGQFYGHKIEGKKPSFIQDLLFLLIGPIWVIKKIAPKLLTSVSAP